MITKFNKLLYNIESSKVIEGVHSGFKKFDDLTNGLKDGQLILIGARQGMGLNAFNKSMMLNIAIINKIPTGVFTFETTSSQVVKRLLSTITGLFLPSLLKGKLATHEEVLLEKSIKELENTELYFFDSPDKTLAEIELAATKMVNDLGVKILFFDYLHFISKIDFKKENNEQDYFLILNTLKRLAVKLNVPIVVKTSLSDDIDTRIDHGKRPTINDLPFSEKTMCIADIVSFVYRPEYYEIDFWEDRGKNSTAGEAELIIAHNRDGFSDTIRLKFIGHLGKFENFEIKHLEDKFLRNTRN